jgi:hypothetical protein
MMLDARDRTEEFFRTLRANLVAAHPDRIRDVFPEWFEDKQPEAAFAGAVKSDGTIDPTKVDESKLTWSVPPDEATNRELERWIAEHMNGTVSAGDLDQAGGDWE